MSSSTRLRVVTALSGIGFSRAIGRHSEVHRHAAAFEVGSGPSARLLPLSCPDSFHSCPVWTFGPGSAPVSETVSAVTHVHGFGYSPVEVREHSIGMDTRLWVLSTPVDGERVELTLVSRIRLTSVSRNGPSSGCAFSAQACGRRNSRAA